MLDGEILAEKRVLLIAPQFFSYGNKIVKALEDYGATVVFFDERPANDFVTKSLIRINRKLVFRKTNKYYDIIIKQAKKKSFDFIIFIRGEAASREKVARLRKECPQAKMILYLWDSVSYSPNSLRISNIFDEVFSFDRENCEQYGFTFEPLFFDDKFYRSAQNNKEKKYDVSFVGTVHTDRLRFLLSLKDRFDRDNVVYFFYWYYPSRILFELRRLFDPVFRNVERSEIKFTPMAYDEMCQVINDSKCVIDINRPKQDGSTMRTLEVLGSGTRLITTNKKIVELSFYHQDCIQVVNRRQPQIDSDFFDNEYPDEVLEKLGHYRLSQWVLRVLCSDGGTKY